MKTIRQTYNINASVNKVWDALVDPKIIDKWGGGPSEMSDKEGQKFKLWGGEVYGKNKKVVKNDTLVQEWFSEDWKKPSIASFKLQSVGNKTRLELVHENVPDKDAEDIDDGWKRYYLGPLKELLESEF